jgi:hypothetical protein
MFPRTRLFLALALFASTPLAGASLSNDAGSLASQTKNCGVFMAEDRFWAIVDVTIGHKDQNSQVEALRTALNTLSAESLLGFHLTFLAQRDRGYSWDLWGAAYVANGGASDDGFEYFLDWLVSRGRVEFEKVLADPDSLADIAPPDASMQLEFETFAGVAGDLWVAKTGKDYGALIDAMEQGSGCQPASSEPTGTPFKDDQAYFAKRYPKLWRRFGEHPSP